KKKICLKSLQKLKLKNKELAKEYDVSKGMICDILKEKKKWLELKSESYEALLKRQIKLECYLKYKESANAPLETLNDMRKNLQSILTDYSLDDIFNTDKIGLY
ncbi:9004_t:CDS:2, partial [Funneliformis caledonium]